MNGYMNVTSNGQQNSKSKENCQTNGYHGKLNGYKHPVNGNRDLELGPHALKARKLSETNHPDPHEAQLMGKVFDLLQEILKDTRDVNK